MENYSILMPYIPSEIYKEVERVIKSRKGNISEIRLRALGRSSVTVGGECVYLSNSPSRNELSYVLKVMCDGALYAFRESLASGYITLSGGIRVGICADARYDKCAFVGLGEPYSLTYRIPSSNSENIDELYSAWQNTEYGMLIYSPPGIGKTTALRSLVKRISFGKDSQNVSVIDERREFIVEDYLRCTVDIFKGYKRSDGIEIALRCCAPDVIVIDEIGGEGEVQAMMGLLNSGVKVIASAHAKCADEVLRRSSLTALFEHKIFDTVVGIYLRGGRRCLKVTRLKF